MKLCFVADGQSPHSQNWIRHLVAMGHEVHLISTYPCPSNALGLASLHIVPLDFSARVRAKEKEVVMGTAQSSGKTKLISSLRGSPLWANLVRVRDQLTPAAVQWQRHKVRRIIEEINPDIVHAMRVPFEGILAAESLRDTSFPLVISIWGNDFTLHAAGSKTIAKLTRRAMLRADGLHPDCEKDLILSSQWNFDRAKPGVVLPGNGGVFVDIFRPGEVTPAFRQKWNIPEGVPVVINPRGLKSYIRFDTFFRAIPLVLAKRPEVIFLGSAMEGKAVVEQWTARLNIRHALRPLPPVSHTEMADFFRLSEVAVSPSEHDGTPNTLLEAMACGSFPVAGNIEPVREWIQHGTNGLLCDPGDPEALAQFILCALENQTLRQQAQEHNRNLICERADCHSVMVKAEAFYKAVIAHKQRSSRVQ